MLMSSSSMVRSRVSPSRGERWREHVTSDASYDGARYMVTVRSAKNLRREGFRGLTNPYCQVSMGRQGPFSTDVVFDSSNPSWEDKQQTFDFKASSNTLIVDLSRAAREEKLSLTCFNHGDVPEVIGRLKLALSPTDHKVITLPMFRKDRGGLQVWAGSMELELRYIPAGDGARAARMSGAIEHSKEFQGGLHGVSEPPRKACSRNPSPPETIVAPHAPMRATERTVAEDKTNHVVDVQPAQSRPTLVPLVSKGGGGVTDRIEDEEGKDKSSREPPDVRNSSGDDKGKEEARQDTRHTKEKGQAVGKLPPVERARNEGDDADDYEDGTVKARGQGGLSLFTEGLKGALGLYEPREARGPWSWKAFFSGVVFSAVLALASLWALGGDARGCYTVVEPLAVELRVVCDGDDKARRQAVIMINGSVASRLSHEDTDVLLGGNKGWCPGEAPGVSSGTEGSPSLPQACSVVNVNPVSLSSGTLGQANSSLGRREHVAAVDERVVWVQRLWRAASRWLGMGERLRVLRAPRDTSRRGDGVRSNGVRAA